MHERAKLTDREIEVLFDLASGKSVRGIHEETGITTGTVKKTISNVYAKLGAANKTDAVVKGISSGILSLEEIPIVQVNRSD